MNPTSHRTITILGREVPDSFRDYNHGGPEWSLGAERCMGILLCFSRMVFLWIPNPTTFMEESSMVRARCALAYQRSLDRRLKNIVCVLRCDRVQPSLPMRKLVVFQFLALHVFVMHFIFHTGSISSEIPRPLRFSTPSCAPFLVFNNILEMICSQKPSEVHESLLRTLEGHQRQILGTLTGRFLSVC